MVRRVLVKCRKAVVKGRKVVDEEGRVVAVDEDGGGS